MRLDGTSDIRFIATSVIKVLHSAFRDVSLQELAALCGVPVSALIGPGTREACEQLLARVSVDGNKLVFSDGMLLILFRRHFFDGFASPQPQDWKILSAPAWCCPSTTPLLQFSVLPTSGLICYVLILSIPYWLRYLPVVFHRRSPVSRAPTPAIRSSKQR